MQKCVTFNNTIASVVIGVFTREPRSAAESTSDFVVVES